MICTFGDITDVTWWRELGLPVRAVIQPNGTLRPVTWGAPGWESADAGARAAALRSAGRLSAAKARAQHRRAAAARAAICVGEPRPITHAVKFYEKGDRPLEIITSRQWFIKTMEFRERAARARPRAAVASAVHAGALRELGQRPERRLVRQPPALLRRAVPGLVSDRRRRHDRLRRGRLRADEVAAADRSVDRRARRATPPSSAVSRAGSSAIPTSWTPGRRRRSRRRSRRAGKTIADLFAQRVPDGCASAGARHHPHVAVLDGAARAPRARSLPWKNAAISGWVLDPDRKKMSKSKGNVVTPLALLEEHGSDGVRYWAASGRPGTDTAFDPGQMKVGRRLAIKLLNASKFVLCDAPSRAAPVTAPSIAACSRARAAGREATRASRGLRLRARAASAPRAFFWGFCDDYLELVKGRRYGDAGAEARGLGQRRAAGGAVGPAAAVRAVPAVRDRGSLVVVAATDRCIARRGRRPRKCSRAVDGREDPSGAGASRARRSVLGEVRAAESARTEAAEGARRERGRT